MVQRMPKKGRFVVMSNESTELIPTRPMTGWRVCMDYRKLSKAIRKDHFPFILLTRCLIDWLAIGFIVSLMGIPIATRLK